MRTRSSDKDLEQTRCSHDDCENVMPPGHEIPPGWTHAVIEKHGRSSISVCHAYTCPNHVLTTAAAQGGLFGEHQEP